MKMATWVGITSEWQKYRHDVWIKTALPPKNKYTPPPPKWMKKIKIKCFNEPTYKMVTWVLGLNMGKMIITPSPCNKKRVCITFSQPFRYLIFFITCMSNQNNFTLRRNWYNIFLMTLVNDVFISTLSAYLNQ